MPDDQPDAPATTGDNEAPQAPPKPPRKPRKRRTAATPAAAPDKRLPFSGYVEPTGAITITIGDAPAWAEPNLVVGLRNLKVDLVELMEEHGYELGY